MSLNSVGFIGGGRVTRIMLRGWQRANALPKRIVVSDPDGAVLAKLKADIPAIEIALNDNGKAAGQALVFAALQRRCCWRRWARCGGGFSGSGGDFSRPSSRWRRSPERWVGIEACPDDSGMLPSIIGAGFNPISFARIFRTTRGRPSWRCWHRWVIAPPSSNRSSRRMPC
ncbi:MAG: NAD(P)-binding domain-containing protein [Betaproteobacteria bacterium]|nr:NAD(P)-binding domain-containing protein [Betaproteobacteria bacterium]